MGKLVDNMEFEKVEITRKLFNRCSLRELMIIESMMDRGEFRRIAIKKEENERIGIQKEALNDFAPNGRFNAIPA
ncbi:hypothetical protein ACUNWD_09970 [Sunxiuqinia sp. A32]|uniref:hypothetical protein n=1 Tax=Sunxiuqinia sp. A32 TaxID=3461496 RepID=UPI004045A7C0